MAYNGSHQNSAKTEFEGESKDNKNLDCFDDWLNVTVQNEIWRGKKLREKKTKPDETENEYFVPDINFIESFVNQPRVRQGHLETCKNNTPQSSPRSRCPCTRTTSAASSYLAINRISRTNTMQMKTKKGKRCPMRIAELAVPTKRQCIETWRNKSDVLPGFMVERLKQHVMEQRPIVKIPEAIYCFQSGRRVESKNCNFRWLSSKHKPNETLKPSHQSHQMDARMLCIVFAHKVAKKLSRPINLTLNSDLEKLSTIVSSDIAQIMSKCQCTSTMRRRQYKAIHKDVSNKITVWITGILEDLSFKLLEEELRVKMETEAQIKTMQKFSKRVVTIIETIIEQGNRMKSKDLEEEEGPVLDFIDDVVETVMNICEPPQLHIDSESDFFGSTKDELLGEESEKPVKPIDNKMSKLEEIFNSETSTQAQTDYGLIDSNQNLTDSEHFRNEISNILDYIITKESGDDMSNGSGDDIENEEVSPKAELEYNTNDENNEVISFEAGIEHDVNDEILPEAGIEHVVNDEKNDEILPEAEKEQHIKDENNVGISPEAGIEHDTDDENFDQIGESSLNVDENDEASDNAAETHSNNFDQIGESSPNVDENDEASDNAAETHSNNFDQIDESSPNVDENGEAGDNAAETHSNNFDQIDESSPNVDENGEASDNAAETHSNNFDQIDESSPNVDENGEASDNAAETHSINFDQIDESSPNVDENGEASDNAAETHSNNFDQIDESSPNVTENGKASDNAAETHSNVSERFEIFTDDSDDDKNSKKVMFHKKDFVNQDNPTMQIKTSTVEKPAPDKHGQWNPKNNKSNIMFAEPNQTLLSHADESWPADLGHKPMLKVSESASKSVSSLGRITENDEKQMASPEDDDSMTDKGTGGTILQVNDILDKMLPTEKHDTASQPTEPLIKVYIETSTKESGETQDDSKILFDKDMCKTTTIPKTYDDKLVGESSKLETYQTDTGESELIRTESTTNTTNRTEDDKIPSHKSQSQVDYGWKVHPKTAPSWVISWGQDRGEPSEDSIPIQIRPTKVTEIELRKWCKELEKAFTNLEIWSNWISSTCKESLFVLQQKELNCPALAQKGAINWIRLKRNVHKDALLWTKLYQRTDKKFKSLKKKYNNIEFSSNKLPSVLNRTVFEKMREIEELSVNLHKMIVAAEYCAMCTCDKTKIRYNLNKEYLGYRTK